MTTRSPSLETGTKGAPTTQLSLQTMKITRTQDKPGRSIEVSPWSMAMGPNALPQTLKARRCPESELDMVGFSVRTRNLLGRLQLSDFQQLAECTEERVLSVPGAGAGTLHEIQSKLAEHGLELAAAPAAPRYRDEQIAKADSRARRMVMLRGEGLTLEAIAQQYGLTRERVRQILDYSGAPDRAQVAEARSRSIRNAVQARAKELTARWARGGEIAELAREAGVSRDVVAEVILETATAADRANHAAAKSARRDLYTDAQLLEGLKQAAGELGRAPTIADYDQWASRTGGVARAATVRQHFDGWLSALHAAGLSEHGTPPRSDRRWTEDACIAAVRMITRETGGWPTVAEYDRLSSSRDDLPCSATLRTRLGRWSLIAASVPRGPRGPRDQRYPPVPNGTRHLPAAEEENGYSGLVSQRISASDIDAPGLRGLGGPHMRPATP